MAYDSAINVVVLFGGGQVTANNETWEWDGTDWALKLPANKPFPRHCHAMAYDSARSVVMIFGSGSGDETWEY